MLKSFFPFAISKVSNYVAFLLSLVVLLTGAQHFASTDPNHIIENDATYYYVYLPSIIVYKTCNINFVSEKTKHFEKQVGRQYVQDGVYVPKMTIGVALCYAPFFVVGHFYSKITNAPTDGYSSIYQSSVFWGGLFFGIMGIWALMALLKLFFSNWVTCLVMVAIFLGTNWFNYATKDIMMSHAYSFTLSALGLYFFCKWFINPKIYYAFLSGMCIGWVVLIRPVNALYGVILIGLILGWFINYIKSNSHSKTQASKLLNEIGTHLNKHKYSILIFSVAGFFMVFLQLIYWKIVTGNWLYYSYHDEHFFWNQPKIYLGLIGFRKGWLLYTPIMIIALLGFIILHLKFWINLFQSSPTKKSLSSEWNSNIKLEDCSLIGLPIICLTIYVTFSWWCWFYGGGFSCRPLIDFYPFLSLGLGYIFYKCFANKFSKMFIMALIISLCGLNIFQTIQFWRAVISPDAMSYAVYRGVFLKWDRHSIYDKQFYMPDYEAAKKGLKEGEEKGADRYIIIIINKMLYNKLSSKTKSLSEMDIEINKIIQRIKSDENWMKEIKRKAKEQNRKFEDVLKDDARWTFEQSQK